MPGPHWFAPEPAFWHTEVPPGLTVQPWFFSRLAAVSTLNGYGFVLALAGAYGLFGSDGTGP